MAPKLADAGNKEGTFNTRVVAPTGNLKMWYRTVAMPLKPPGAILLGIKKKLKERAVSKLL